MDVAASGFLHWFTIVQQLILVNSTQQPRRDPYLHFVESPALAPPEVQIDLAAQQVQENELLQAANQPLPDDDDDTFE